MITVLVGMSGTGKSSVARELHEKHGYEQIITCTTRIKRSNEVDGVDYQFLTNSEFDSKLSSDEFLEHTQYDTVYGPVSYGSLKESYEKSDKDRVIILNPDGVLSLIRYKMTHREIDSIQIILLKASMRTLRVRLFSRGDEPEEIERRLEADENDFEKLEDLINRGVIRTISVDSKSIDEIIENIFRGIYDDC